MLQILSGTDPHGHVHAAESLYKVVEIGDGTALRNAFSTATNMKLKLMAAGAIGRCGHQPAMQFIRDMLKDQDPENAKISAWLLGVIGDIHDIPRIKAELPRCTDELAQAYLNNALAILGDAEGLRALTKNLQSENNDVRTYSANFAGDAKAVSVVPQLKKMLDDPHPDAAIRAAQSLLQMSRPPAPNSREDVSVVTYPSTKQNPRYTEGSVIERNDGSLLFAVTEFSGSGSDFASASIIARQSTDGGRTWGEQRVLQQNTGEMNVMSVTLRRLKNGRIAMFYLKKNSHSDLDVLVRFSDDEGVSFGDSVLVTADPGYHVMNNDRVQQLSTGRLVAPVASCPDVKTNGHFKSHCYLSDDNGQTWRNGTGSVDAPKRGAMEPEVVELKEGRILMIIRNQLGYVGKSYSRDGGETWTEMTTLGLQAPEAPSTLRRIPATGDLVLIWNNSYAPQEPSGGPRTPLSAAISQDEGETWTIVENLESCHECTFAYTSLVFVGERMVMSYWDTGVGKGNYSCRFRSLPVNWLYQHHQ